MLGLCLVAVFAVAAVAATSASALPEWGKCEKVAPKTGAFTDANCTVKAKPLNSGEFKWRQGKELAPLKFSGENVGSGGVLATDFDTCEGGSHNERRVPRSRCEEGGGTQARSPVQIECESEHNTGEAVGAKTVANVSVKFLGCKVFGSVPCSNGPKEGEIQVNPLKGSLGYINKAEKKVGVLLEPSKKHGDFASFNCGGVLATTVGVGNVTEGAYYLPEKTGGYDGVISPITPVNTMTSKYEQVYTVNPETDENIPSKFEGKHIELLEDYLFLPTEPQESTMWSPSGEEITNVNTPAEEGEIKA
ncbi:MAG: hypothetical protein ACHP7P_15265 [Terriglobales bacterium]